MREQKKRKERAEWKVGPMCHVDATWMPRQHLEHLQRSAPYIL